MNPERWAPRLVMGSVLLGSALASVRAPAAETSQPPRVPQALQERAQREGSARVIVELRLGSGKGAPEGLLPGTQAVRSQRSEIAAVQDRVLTRLASRSHRLHHRFGAVPFVALDVDAAALAALEADPEVERVVEDRLVAPVLAQSVPLVQGDVAWDFGYDGTGQVVAIVDSGVDGAHPFLAGKVVEEACYASGNGCPNGLSTQFGVGAAVPCPFDPDSCLHGTHVAGIAAGSGTSFSGVARGAHLMAIQVFHPSTTDCTILENVPCARAFSSDIGAGLEHVYDLRTQYTIAAANLSLGGGSFTSTCDNQEPQLTAQIANLRSVGIATVIASGNDGKTRSLAFPACISSAVSVASTDKSDQVSWFSDVASFLSLFAPGEQINSSVPGGGFEVLDGTSMAAPHVAGAWAILRQANPTASVSTLLQTLQLKGLPITDTRGNKPITKSRIRILDALGLSLPLPVLNSISPLAVSAWGPDFSLTVNGTGFFHSSVVRVNGAARATTYINATTLTALVSASDIASTSAGLTIGVFNPAPGGGASGTTTLALRQPVLTVNTASVSAGGQVTATLTNAPGGVADWLALAAVGAANTSYLQWTYVGGGVNTRTWTVVLPSVGNYEFRLFINNGYTRVATSPPVAAVPGPPAALAVSATSAAAGSAVTVTLANGAGGAQDWLSLAAVGSPDTSILQ